eukprot:CAMPEP_0170572620 /NCGR_PEP_ID=MMETSP0224-20130122/2315_1 /TAXON_ID=285029 /ORGANISM="Togula jolla, Strain CCCM 725" /LENGTH=856 /DNA_ID=CAMNT_0010895125 /DNA_START=37 /DNA_END=2604 /DNA_ORIENTATION=-
MTASIDDVFRQKSLSEIHGILKQTRNDVETKKKDLRELVGNHYRSVLESSDHIREMSTCAAKVSAGANRVEELIGRMRTLAATPLAGGAAPEKQARPADEDHEYLVGLRIIALFEVPETVRAHLGANEFVRAARGALVEAAALQSEVDDLLKAGPLSGARKSALNFSALVQQQVVSFRGLPRQISASCVDAFSAVSLDPRGAAESFVVRLLLDPNTQPAALMRLFLERRSDLLNGLLDGNTSGPAAPEDGSGPGLRLAAVAMALEGTVVLASSLCRTSGEVPVARALDALLEDASGTERPDSEARAREGSLALSRRVEALRSLLRSTEGAVAAALTELGGRLAADWTPSALARRLRRATAAPKGSTQTCAALSELLVHCTDKVQRHRGLLAGADQEWQEVWSAACGRFSSSRTLLCDALTVVVAAVDAACSDVVRERIGELQLELGPSTDGHDAPDVSHDISRAGAVAGPQAGDRQRREELLDMQIQSRLRVARFDEQLGEVVADMAHARGSEARGPVMAALLSALEGQLDVACSVVRTSEAPLPSPGREGETHGQEQGANASTQRAWTQQRSMAHAAIAVGALLSAADDEAGAGDTHLCDVLRKARSSGDAQVAEQAQAMLSKLTEQSSVAYSTWARMVVLDGGISSPDTFWRLADDEVPVACGWGTAKFAKEVGSGEEATRGVPIPIQASSFVFERLALGSRRALEINGSGPMPRALTCALKWALSESLASVYASPKSGTADLEALRRGGMHHLLQLIFDLRFLRIALSVGGQSGESVNSSYEALSQLLDRSEAVALNDPVDRLLYQEVLRASVKAHIEVTRVLLAPLFLHNPLHGFLFDEASGAQGQARGGHE